MNKQKDAVRGPVEKIVYNLKYLCDCIIPHCGDHTERKDAQLKIDKIIKSIIALKSRPVDIEELKIKEHDVMSLAELEEGVWYPTGWNDCLDHLKKNGYRITKI